MVTERDRLRGTLLYMSPEHIQGFGVTDSCDIYALGTVMYECLTGSPPVLIGSENLTLDDVVWRQVAHMPPQLNDVVPAMPQYLGRTIQQMLAKEAVLRFATMEEVASRLREARRRIKAGDDQPDSEPKKASAGRIAIAPALDISTPELAAAAVREIAKNAAELDVGANSRCPPPLVLEQDSPPEKPKRVLLAAAICIGSLAGLGIAIYKAESDHGATEQPRAIASATRTQQVAAATPPPPADPSAISHATNGPVATKTRAGTSKNIERSSDYSVVRSPPAASASNLPQPVVISSAQAKSKRPKSGDLIF
jgi:serine/threonine protein kinase